MATVTRIDRRGRNEEAWVQTASGRAVVLGGTDESVISMRDIAAHLAKIVRFNGATHTPYSVAQHSVEVADCLVHLGPEAQLHGLLHDAAEAYVGDINAAVKRLLRQMLPYNPLDDLEEAMHQLILKACGLKPPTPAIAAAVHAADMAVLAAERRDLMAECPHPWNITAQPRRGKRIVPWGWSLAEQKFLDRYHSLTAALGMQMIQ